MMRSRNEQGLGVFLRAGLAFGLIASWMKAGEPTSELLTAPHVRSYVRIVPDKDSLRVALDGRDVDYSEPLTVVVSGKVKFVIADYNPLTIEVKLDAVETDDPSHAALEKFLAAFYKTFAPASISSQADAVAAAKGLAESTGCPVAEQAEKLLISFDAALRPGEVKAETVKSWADGAIGRDGMRKQSLAIGSEGANLTRHARNAKATLGDLDALRASLESSSNEIALGPPTEALKKAREDLEKARAAFIAATRHADKGTASKQHLEALEAAEHRVRAAETDLTRARTAGSCPRQVLALLAVFFRTQPMEQVDRLARLGKAATDLAASLTKTADNNELWFPAAYGPGGDAAANASSRDYVLDSKGPKVGKIVTVTITARRTTLSIVDGSIEKSAVPKSDSKTVFHMREHSLFAPELGVGLVLASVKTPTYGAVKDESGATVVSKTKVQERDFKAALMLNAVCRCWNDAFLYPMLQFGIAPDKEAPAIFAGAGFRFIRPRGLGLSAGAVLAWVKDLDKLGIGSTVESQALIDADLKAQPTVKPYFALQYNF